LAFPGFSGKPIQMASQKVANCFVAANYLVTAAYPSTPHSSKFARLAFGDFCLAIPENGFLRTHQFW
jgi:hypothetical protein